MEYVLKNECLTVSFLSFGGSLHSIQDEDGLEYLCKLVFACEEECTVPAPVTESGLIDMEHRTKFLEKQKELRLSHELFAKDAVILDKLRSRSVTMCTDRHGKGVQLDFQDFPYLILWSSPNRGPFLAMEPWTGLSTCSDEGDRFEEKRNMQTAEPGKMKKYSYTIRIL